jgi:hypothetical protein
MNAEAAASHEAAGTVSVGCSVTSFRRDGRGFQDLTEGTTAQPRSLMNASRCPISLRSWVRMSAACEALASPGSFQTPSNGHIHRASLGSEHQPMPGGTRSMS